MSQVYCIRRRRKGKHLEYVEIKSISVCKIPRLDELSVLG